MNLNRIITTLLSLLFMTTQAHAFNDTPIKRTLQSLIDNDHFAGFTVLIDQPGRAIWQHSFGFANREKQIKSQPRDHYRIASSTKSIIATAAIKLAMANKIQLDAKLTDYLDQHTLSAIANADQVSIRQLLSMQSGIYNYTDNPAFGKFVDDQPSHTWTAQDALRFARNMPASFKVGSQSEYSNTNYILLGLVIEKVSKQPLAEALDTLIFKPLKMNKTYLENSQSATKGKSVPGYQYLEDGYKNIDQINDGRGLADGGVVTTASDLNQFIRALMTDDQFMPPNWRQQMLKFHKMKSEDMVQYGLGLILFPNSKYRLIGHDGSDSGYQSWMLFAPKSKTSIIVLTNSNPPRLDQGKLLKAFEQSQVLRKR